VSRPRAVARPDATNKVSGVARYTEDLQPRDLLRAVAVRSPIAAGRIVRLDVEAARAGDGVRAVLTAEDLPDRRWGTVLHDQPILARGWVRFAGEPVVLIAAETAQAAQAAAALVELEIDPVRPVVGLAAALDPEAPETIPGRENVGPGARIERGDVDAAFLNAAHVIKTRIEVARVHQGYIEPRATLVEPGPDGGIVVTTSSQSPFVVRVVSPLCSTCRSPRCLRSAAASAASSTSGWRRSRPCSAGPPGARSGLSPPGRRRCTRRIPGRTRSSSWRARSTPTGGASLAAAGYGSTRGACAFDTPMIASIAALQGTGPYRAPAVDLQAWPVYTNTCPTGSFRGPSGPQLVYANETHIADIADAVGLDAVEVRRRNILRSGDRGPSGELLPDVGMEDCLDVVTERIDQWRREAPESSARRGYGIACAWWLTTGSPPAATVAMNEDGTVAISTGGTEIGTGAVISGVAALAADELGVALEDVNIVSANTGDTPYDAGSKGSRTLYGAGNAVLEASIEVARLLREEAAEQLEAAPEDIILSAGRIGVRGSPAASSIPIAKVVQGALNRTGPVVGTGRFRGRSIPLEGPRLNGLYFDAFNEPTFHCHGVEIELDEETGRIEILRYVAPHDIGTVLNPAGARGQIEGGVVQGLGQALSEVMELDADGLVRNANLVDYRLPTISDVPRSIESVMIENHPAPTGPKGAKGVGEAPVILPPAAVGAALRDLVGAQPDRLPLDPVRVCEFLDALSEARAEVGR
jgi:CO/xanthine dehydrogenase Mo-binding subunit